MQRPALLQHLESKQERAMHPIIWRPCSRILLLPESLSALCACKPATTKRQCSIFERSLQEKNGLVMESPGPVLPVKVAKASEPEEEAELRLAAMVCSLENKDECLMCGS